MSGWMNVNGYGWNEPSNKKKKKIGIFLLKKLTREIMDIKKKIGFSSIKWLNKFTMM